MATVLRLARAGAKKAPVYHVVAADSRFPRDGRFIEMLGTYNPRTEPEFIQLKNERIDYWISKGARPSERVAQVIKTWKKQRPAAE